MAAPMARPRSGWCGAAGRATPSSSHPPRGQAPGYTPVAAGVRAGCPARCPGSWPGVHAEGAGVRCGGRCVDTPGTAGGRRVRTGVRLAVRPGRPAVRIRPGCSPCGAAPACLSALLHRTVRPGGQARPRWPPHAGRLSTWCPHCRRRARTQPRCHRAPDGQASGQSIHHAARASPPSAELRQAMDGSPPPQQGRERPAKRTARPVDGLEPVSQSCASGRGSCRRR
jgi:hypothetical protein